MECLNDPILSAIKKYSNHPSIVRIKREYGSDKNKFHFHHVTPELIVEKVGKLNTKKSSSGEIPIHILKTYIETIKNSLTDSINNSINDGIFPIAIKIC